MLAANITCDRMLRSLDYRPETTACLEQLPDVIACRVQTTTARSDTGVKATTAIDSLTPTRRS